MRKYLITIIACLALITLVSAGYAYRRGYGIPSIHSLEPLTLSEISEKVDSQDYKGILISFYVSSKTFQYTGYIFEDRTCIFFDYVDAKSMREFLTEEKWKEWGTPTPEKELYQVLDFTPEGDYTNYFHGQISSEDFTSLLTLIQGLEMYDSELGILGTDTGIMYSLQIYINSKIASFNGQFFSGYNGTGNSSTEGVNKALYDFFDTILFPFMRENGTPILSEEYNALEGENLEKYPFVLVYDRDNPDNILAGDLSLWES